MPADFTVKQGDTQPVLTDALTYSDGSQVNLSGATVRLVMRALSDPAPVSLKGTVAVTDPAKGALAYTFAAADTGTPGMFMANWLVTFSGGQTMTFPTVGYLWVAVEENLTTAGGQQLVSLPDVKDYLSIPATDRSRDAKLVRYIHAARPLIEAITGPIILDVFDEWHDGGQTTIRVRRRPSTAPGTSPILRLVGVDEYRGSMRWPLPLVADPSLGQTYSVTLDPRDGSVTRRSAGGGTVAFAAGPGSVHVIYQAGQQTVPANVYEATLELLRVNYETTQQVGSGRFTEADTLETGPPLGFFMPRRVREMLSPNRRAPSIA